MSCALPYVAFSTIIWENLGLSVVLVELTSQIFSTNQRCNIVATLLFQHCGAIDALQILPCHVTLRWSLRIQLFAVSKFFGTFLLPEIDKKIRFPIQLEASEH